MSFLFRPLQDGEVTAAKIGANAVTEAKINAGAVTAAKIGASAVTEAKINAGAVTVAKIGASAVTEAKINAGAVTADKIGASAVTADKIGASAVTGGKISRTVTATGSQSMGVGTAYAPTDGVKQINNTNFAMDLELYIGGGWKVFAGSNYTIVHGVCYFDGANMQLRNNAGIAFTLYWQEF